MMETWGETRTVHVRLNAPPCHSSKSSRKLVLDLTHHIRSYDKFTKGPLLVVCGIGPAYVDLHTLSLTSNART